MYMEIRLAKENDFGGIYILFDEAIKYMQSKNNFVQWQEIGFFCDQMICNLIESKSYYVILHENEIIGGFSLLFGKEKTYKTIKDGAWLNDELYVTIHKIASKYQNIGIATYALKYIEELAISKKIYNIRIDTYKDNIPMQEWLNKNNFTYCGIISLKESFDESSSLRLAFQKQLKENL